MPYSIIRPNMLRNISPLPLGDNVVILKCVFTNTCEVGSSPAWFMAGMEQALAYGSQLSTPPEWGVGTQDTGAALQSWRSNCKEVYYESSCIFALWPQTGTSLGPRVWHYKVVIPRHWQVEYVGGIVQCIVVLIWRQDWGQGWFGAGCLVVISGSRHGLVSLGIGCSWHSSSWQ